MRSQIKFIFVSLSQDACPVTGIQVAPTWLSLHPGHIHSHNCFVLTKARAHFTFLQMGKCCHLPHVPLHCLLLASTTPIFPGKGAGTLPLEGWLRAAPNVEVQGRWLHGRRAVGG